MGITQHHRAYTRAYTLLELMLVLVIVSLLAARAVVVWSSTYKDASFESAVGRIGFLDQHARRYARMHGEPFELVFDTRGQRIGRTDPEGGSNSYAWEPLPRGIEIATASLASTQKRSDKVTVGFNRDGVSDTYGLHVTGPGDREAWLVLAGVSGQPVSLEGERQFHEALAAIAGTDPH